MNEADIFNLVQRLAPQLIEQRKMLASAESCTGGWIAKSITDMDGS
ncbi:Nicotinamide-nucleotide amidase, partial [hydrothermal vent metagenome]